MIKNIFKFLSLPLILSALVSCEPGRLDPVDDGAKVSLNFSQPSIVSSPPSKGLIKGSNFPNSHNPYHLGLWLMSENSYDVPQIQGFGNMKAEYHIADGVNRWLYYPFGADEAGRASLDILRDRPLDIYAYYPWVEGASDITRIPFVSGEEDWMVATPVKLTQGQTASAVETNLAFRHLMTCIQVNITCKYEGAISLTSMSLTDSKERLIASGTFSCVDGSVTGTKVGTITITPRRALKDYFVHFYILMPQVGGMNLSEGEMKLSFVFNGIDAETEFVLPPTMKLSGVDMNIDEFKAGYKYVYNLTLDNTMDFVPVGFGEWTEEEVLLPI